MARPYIGSTGARSQIVSSDHTAKYITLYKCRMNDHSVPKKFTWQKRDNSGESLIVFDSMGHFCEEKKKTKTEGFKGEKQWQNKQ